MVEDQIPFGFAQRTAPEICFFALRPDAAAAREMMRVGRWCRDRHAPAARLYGADRLHVSVVPAMSRRGRRRDDVGAAVRAAAGVRAPSFSVAFDRLCTFGGGERRPIVLLCRESGATAFSALRHSLRAELLKVGLWHGAARFQPHITLFWSRDRVPEVRLDEPIRWTVEEFVLVRSMIGSSHHIELARWPLHERSRSA